MTRVEFQRAVATSPGKHGPLDWRVEYNGSAPRHAEVVFMVGMLLLAEERYNAPGQDGRLRLWYFLDRLLFACKHGPDAVLAVADDCQESVDNPASLTKQRVA